MRELTQIEFLDIEEKKEFEKIINSVIEECFTTEGLIDTKLYVSIILTSPQKIKELNHKYRKIDKETDVLSFPMFEKDDINENISKEIEEPLGDIVISIDRVKEQAKEYGHSFERELAYMVVHGFYHLMGYDHIQDTDKIEMRQKEENVLNKLKITRED